MASPPDLSARSMAARAGAESRSGRVPSQNQVWVSRRITASPCATAAALVSASEARGPSSLPREGEPCPTSRMRSEEHTSELQSRLHLVCRLLLEKKKKEVLQCYSQWRLRRRD